MLQGAKIPLTMPSIPWGSSRTMPLLRTHLAWPELMNWSMIHWAVLWKSPNCASQRMRAFGLAMAKPSSKPGVTVVVMQSFKINVMRTCVCRATISPNTPYSDRELLQTVYGAWLDHRWFMGTQIRLSTSWSWRTWWRWLLNRNNRDTEGWKSAINEY